MPKPERLKIKASVFLSSFGALVIQMIWMRRLQTIIGSSALAFGLVTTVFLLSLSLGSLCVQKFEHLARNRRLSTYSICEFLIVILVSFNILSISIFFDDILSGRQYLLGIGSGAVSHLIVDFFLSTLIISPSAFFMGMTLPILMMRAGTVESKKIYALNCLGAGLGAFLTYTTLFYFLGFLWTILTALGFHLMAGLLLLKPFSSETDQESRSLSSEKKDFSILLLSFCSGFIFLSLEQIWFRFSAIALSNRIFTPSIVLSGVLIGLSLASYGQDKVLKLFRSNQALMASFFVFLATASFCVGMFLYEPLAQGIFNPVGYFKKVASARNLIFLGFMVFIPSFSLGQIFPLILEINRGQKKSWKDGQIIAVNTLGALLGGLTTAYLLIGFLGIMNLCKIIFLILNLFFLIQNLRLKRRSAQFLSFLSILSCFLLFGVKSDLVRIGKVIMESEDEYGLTTIIDLKQSRGMFFNFSSLVAPISKELFPETKRIQEKLAFYPASFSRQLNEVLVIGLGYGLSSSAFIHMSPDVKVTSVELLPGVISGQKYFQNINRSYFLDPRSQIIRSDGRAYLAGQKKSWDIISVNIEPYSAGTTNLLSEEFYRLVSRRLNKGGVFCQLLLGTPDIWKAIYNSVKKSFPHVYLFPGYHDDGPILLAGKDPLTISRELFQNDGKTKFVLENHHLTQTWFSEVTSGYDEKAIHDFFPYSEMRRGHFWDIFNRYPSDY